MSTEMKLCMQDAALNQDQKLRQIFATATRKQKETSKYRMVHWLLLVNNVC